MTAYGPIRPLSSLLKRRARASEADGEGPVTNRGGSRRVRGIPAATSRPDIHQNRLTAFPSLAYRGWLRPPRLLGDPTGEPNRDERGRTALDDCGINTP